MGAARLQNPSLRLVDAQTRLTDTALCQAVREMAATRKASRWFFVLGFEKSERANVSPHELEALQALPSVSAAYFGVSRRWLAPAHAALTNSELIKSTNDVPSIVHAVDVAEQRQIIFRDHTFIHQHLGVE